MTGGRTRENALPGWRVWTAVAVGGLAGSEARYLLTQLYPPLPGTFDTMTFTINVAASAALGFLTSWWLFHPAVPFWLRAGLGPGLLGSFSTFSALALSVETLLASGRHGTWLLYAGLSAAAGLAAAGAGLAAGRRLARRRGAPQ
ncbi:CrcB family protein [Arthrobacter sp. Sa2CUA1]|uniref:Fluoride-specific ion channel FluC n=1 Tax=Arthrobacter gallicola TaxID=2762225 RepID=A0ABR8USB0_9MICC|nr:CrcB family protein [Arthrobacter gallicola]MBD7995428.1 CrcB family protein [Arthrobacter gallicola]